MTAEDQLEYCLEEIAAGRKTVAECVALYPETPDLEARLGAAQTLRAWPPPELGPQASEAMEQRLREHLRQQPHSTWRDGASMQRAAAVPASRKWALSAGLALILVVSLATGGGLVYASSGALPGDALYPVKTSLEAARLGLAFSEAQAVTLRLEFSERRLDEIEALVNANRLAQVPETLEAYTAEVQAAITAVDAAAKDTTARQVRGQAQAELHAQRARLGELRSQLPSQAQTALDRAEGVSNKALEQLDAGGLPTAEPEVTVPQPGSGEPARRGRGTQTAEPTPGSHVGGGKPTSIPEQTPDVNPTPPAPKPTRMLVPTSMPGQPGHMPETPPTPKS